MPEVRPFRGVHYDPARVGDLTKVMTQPYDRIDAALQEEYYRRHPNSFIRIDRRKEEPGDATGMKKYAAAAAEFEGWRKEGILVQDPAPALYAYHQAYKAPDGTTRVRKGVSALVRLEEPGRGRIHAHEETHSGPKIDRRHLLDATRTHLSHVFLLYADAAGAVNRALDPFTTRPPDLEAADDYGERHKVWKVDDAAAIASARKTLEPMDAIIADGHHRYETAWGYAQDQRRAGGEPADFVLATLVNLEDEGLTIFGTHRLIHGLPSFDAAALLKKAAESFEVREFPSGDRKRFLEAMKAEGATRPAFGFASKERLHLFVVRDTPAAAARVAAKKSEAWRSLDVNLLHSVVLEGMLGITPEHTKKEQYVEYLRSADEAIDRARAGGSCQAAFLVNPVRIDAIRKIVLQGERFPQKTTDFYPKLLSGLVMCRLADARS